MTAMFDTLGFARVLREDGRSTPEQSERLSDALPDAIAGEVVARADLAATEAKPGRKIDDLRAELAAIEAKLHRRIDGLHAAVEGVGKGLEAKFEAAKADTIKWVVGIISFQGVAIIGAAIVLARILAR